MKAKLKSANGFTRFMLAHGEKLGMSAVVVLAGLLIYSTFGRPRLEDNKQPTNLQSEASRATSHVQSRNWNEFAREERLDAGMLLVSVNPEKPVVGNLEDWQIRRIDSPPIPEVGKRLDPELLPLEKMEVSTGSGLWAWADPEIIRRRLLEERKRAQQQEREDEEERERAEREGDGFGRGGDRGGRGGRGGFDGGRGGFGSDGTLTRDGAMVIRPNAGAQVEGYEDIRNTSWAIVKAKVPIRAQYKNFDEALASTIGYSAGSDIPTYIGYEVQRAEVTEAGDGQWQTIKKVVPKVLITDMESWPIQAEDLINPKYKHPLLTYPLPPMVLRAWDASVTHSELPIPTPEELMGGMDGMDGGRGPARDAERNRRGNREEGEGDLFQGAAEDEAPAGGGFGMDGGRGGFDGGRGGFDGGRGMPPGRGGFDGGRGGFGGGRGGGRGGFDGGRGGGRGGFDGGRGGMMGGGAGSVDPSMFTAYSWDGMTRYLLFRYFDYTVEPGKKYRYRVRLALKDVNAAPVPEKYLDEAVIARRNKENTAFVMSPFSEPSPVAVVPQAGLVYVAGAKPANPTNPAAEPEAELLIKGLDARSASEAAVQDMFSRGTVLNLIGQQAKVIWSSTFEPTDRNGDPVDSPKFNFRTGLTLLDFAGGEVLAGNRELTAPARVVLMDGAGRLTIKGELDDLKPVNEYKFYEEEAADAVRRNNDREDGRGGRGGMDGGGRGGGRGGRGG